MFDAMLATYYASESDPKADRDLLHKLLTAVAENPQLKAQALEAYEKVFNPDGWSHGPSEDLPILENAFNLVSKCPHLVTKVWDSLTWKLDMHWNALNLHGRYQVKNLLGLSTDWQYVIQGANINPDDIDGVIRAAEGAPDDENWLAIFRMKSGQWCFVEAYCSYTGWEDHSSVNVAYADTYEDLVRWHMDDDSRSRFKIGVDGQPI